MHFSYFAFFYCIANGSVYSKHRKPTIFINLITTYAPYSEEAYFTKLLLTPSEDEKRGMITAMGWGGIWGGWSGREFGRTQTEPEERLLKNIFFFHLLPFHPTMFSWIKDSFKWMNFSFKMQTYPSENKTPFFIQLFIWNMLIKLLAFRKYRFLLQWEELREFIF